jgi:mycofactocin system glycosyltransferase
VVSPSPLYVVDVNAAAARLLQRTRGGATVSELAVAFRVSEERILSLCERFRRRGVLDVERVAAGPESAGPNTAGAGGAGLPSVTVIVPTRDRADSLDECLQALGDLDYPRDLLEVIVVDDGSADPAAVAAVAARHRARLLSNDRNRGPSYSRNRAAGEAAGHIVALIDSDCVACPGWLRELVPYFAWERAGAVGGRTVGYFTESSLDRYEEVASPLDMGSRLRMEADGADGFYLPTCNLLVRRTVLEELQGLREDLRVGEDVDFCWRLRARGYYLIYAPEGVVRHKHRDRLCAMLCRRAAYGTSEAVLYRLHPDKRKRFPLAPAPLASVVLVACATLRLQPRLLPAALIPVLGDGVRRLARLRREGVAVTGTQVWSTVLRTHLGMLYFTYFHLQRYYLLPLLLAGTVAPGAWALAASAVVYAAAVDYSVKRPRLGFANYLAYYAAEHLAYQTGVIAGCLREGTFRSYLPVLVSRVGGIR